jgi:hypothetical protein
MTPATRTLPAEFEAAAAARDDWREGLTTGSSAGPAFAAWIATEADKGRTDG